MAVRSVVLFFSSVFILTFAHAQERIITAGSALTETVCALGACDQIIASDRTSLYPAQIQQLPSIGYRSGINAEGIISMKPTMIIAEREYVEETVLRQLQSTSIELVIVDRDNNWDDTKKFIRQIATALRKEAEGEKLIAANEAQLAEAAALLKQTTSKPKVICVYNRGAATISTAGKNTFGDITHYIGATNAFAGETGYKPLNTEAMIAANPDYFLMLKSGFESIGGVDGVLNIPGVTQTTAGKKKQFVVIDALKLTNFGPRFGETVKELVVALHPELRSN